jgi:predicted nuclease of predicted toxin-antitoxin system
MLRLLTDENFDNDILRGLLRSKPDLDVIRVQDVELSGEDDPVILEWAANEKRILLTHDVTTITDFAYERIRVGKYMPGVFEVPLDAPIKLVIEDILLLAAGSLEGEWENQVVYLPLR